MCPEIDKINWNCEYHINNQYINLFTIKTENDD